MTIVWKSRWNTGLEAIDRQHHSIAEHINKLGTAIPSAKTSQPESHDHDADEYAHYAFLFQSLSTGEFSYVLEDLIVCLETHFDFEENLHQQTHYQLRRH